MNRHIGYLIKNLNDKIKSKADADLKTHNLTLSQSRVLAFLSKHDGVSTQKEIEVFLGISHPTVVGIISRMERNGYIICTVDDKDRRNKIISLTEKAVAFRERIVQKIEHDEKEMLRTLSEEDVENLSRILRVIYNNIEEEQNDD